VSSLFDWNITDGATNNSYFLDDDTSPKISNKENEIFSNDTVPHNASNFQFGWGNSAKSNNHDETGDNGNSSNQENVPFQNSTTSDGSIFSSTNSTINDLMSESSDTNNTMPNASLNEKPSVSAWTESILDNASAWNQENATNNTTYNTTQEQDQIESNSAHSNALNTSDNWFPTPPGTNESIFDGNASSTEAFNHGPELVSERNVTLAETTFIGQVGGPPNATWPEATPPPLPPLGPDGLPLSEGNVSDGDWDQDEGGNDGGWDGGWDGDSGNSDVTQYTTSLASADSDGRGGDSTTPSLVEEDEAPGDGPEGNVTEGDSNATSMQVFAVAVLVSRFLSPPHRYRVSNIMPTNDVLACAGAGLF
jgi:hypothetical protein